MTNDISPDEVLAVIDITIFRGGQKGIVLTNSALFYRGSIEKPRWTSYDNWESFDIPDDAFFSRRGIAHMLSLISDAIQDSYWNSSNTSIGKDNWLKDLLSIGVEYALGTVHKNARNQVEDLINTADQLLSSLESIIELCIENALNNQEDDNDQRMFNVMLYVFLLSDNDKFIEDFQLFYSELGMFEPNNGEYDEVRDYIQTTVSLVGLLIEQSSNVPFSTIKDVKLGDATEKYCSTAEKCFNSYLQNINNNSDYYIEKAERATREFLNKLQSSYSEFDRVKQCYIDCLNLLN